MPATYPDNFELKIGFDRIRQMLHANCLSPLGKEKVGEMSFCNDFQTINHLTNLAMEFLRILVEHDNFPTSNYFDLREALQKTKIEGTFLEVDELFDLKRSLEALQGIVNFFKATKENDFAGLKELVSGIANFSVLIKEIDRILTKHGTIKDNASPELHEIRKQISSLQGSISKRMHAILRQLQSEGIVDDDTSVSIRDGRPVIPVSSALKKKINGIVHDESSTGKTAFVEPAEIVEANNRLRELENAERREIVRILVAFTSSLRPYYEDLVSSYSVMGEIDFIRSKAVLARQFDCTKPQLKDFPFFDWQQAKHPILTQALKKENREVIPLNIRLDDPNRILLISGPNAGGKSVCLKTVGIIQYMLQCGLLVPVSEGSGMGVFRNIFIDIGDEQSLENDLSTYSSHLLNMKYFTLNCNKDSLVLIDEFGTGTEPMLGGAIAEAVLNKLNQLQTYGIITTHYTNLKHFGSSTKGIVNGAMLYDSNGMKPLFKLQIGKPGSSFAFEIARKIGLSEEILNEATEKLGKEHIDYDKHLREIVRDKEYWESKRQKIRKVEKSLDTLSEEYQTELEKTQKMRREIMAEAKREAQQIITDANKLVENTIREIRESQAEKEVTKEIRKKLTDYKEKVESIDPEQEERIKRQMEKIQNRQNKEKTKKSEHLPVPNSIIKKPETFRSGDKVRLKDGGAIVEVIDTDGEKVVVAIGHLMSTLPVSKVETISNNEVKRQEQVDRMKPKADSLKRTNELREKKLSFKADIDVRGQRAEEALSNIQEFIDNAVVVGSHTLRILHGKGYGILKEVIRQYLKSEPAVKSFRDEHVQFGGAGITIVELE